MTSLNYNGIATTSSIECASIHDDESAAQSPLLFENNSRKQANRKCSDADTDPETDTETDADTRARERTLPLSFKPSVADRYLKSITLTQNASFYHATFSNIRGNLSAGISVALINVPLSISLAVAGQSDPVSGVITAIWAGAMAALIGGSQFNIYGPTGALSGILSRYATRYGMAVLSPLAGLSAFWCFIAYLLDLQHYLLFLPNSVMQGFSHGVAIIVGMSQFNSALGLVVPSLHETTIMNWYESFIHLSSGDVRIFCVFFILWLTLFFLVEWKRSIPWSILIACIGIFLGFLSSTGWIFHLPTLRDKFGDLHAQLYQAVDYSTIGAHLDDFSWSELVSASLSIAFVTLLESLISGKIADEMSMSKTSMNEKNELLGAAVANLFCAITGGIPATAALARTALNIRSGATTRLSGFSSAMFTMIICVIFMPMFSYLPLCVVAALLAQVSAGMMQCKQLSQTYHVDPFSFYLALVVAVSCVVLDPTSALILGASVGLLRFARQNSRGFADVVVDASNTAAHPLPSPLPMDGSLLPGANEHSANMMLAMSDENHLVRPRSLSSSVVASIRREINEENVPDGRPKLKIALYRVVGDLTYISAATHQSHVQRLFNHRAIILSLRYVNFVDIDGISSLGEMIAEAAKHQCRVVLCSIQPSVKKFLARTPWFATETAKGNVLDTGKIALETLTNLILEDRQQV